MNVKLSPETLLGKRTASSSQLARLIPASGEMAELVRTHDWASTPLGPVESWPDALLSTVNLVLSSPFSSSLFWGPEFIFFYNDAYRPLVSSKHPDCLGGSGPVVWKEAWGQVGAEYDAVFHRGESVLRENVLLAIEKEGRLQDFYFIYTLTPVYDRGTVVGVFNRSQDTTEAIVANRKLHESEARARRVLQSIGDAVIVTDAEARVTRMNPVAEELTGWPIDEAEGRPLSEVFHILNEHTRLVVDSPAEKVRQLGVAVGLANHTILVKRDGAEVSIDDSAAPIRDDAGSLTGIVLVFRDIGERRAVERDRERLAEQLKISLASAAQGTWYYEPKTGLVIGDEQMCRIYGARREGGPPEYWFSLIHPDDRGRVAADFGGGITRERPYDSEYRIVDERGVRWVRAKGQLIADHESLIGIYGIAEDITARKEIEMALALAKTRQTIQLKLLQSQRITTDDRAMMVVASEAVGRHLNVDRVGFLEIVNEDTMQFEIGWTNGRLPLLNGTMPSIAIGTVYLAEVREGKVDGISDVTTDPRTRDSMFAEIGARAIIGVPILRRGRWVAGMYVNHSEVREWTDEEINFVCDIGEQAWDAIERARVQRDLTVSEERVRMALSAGNGIGTWDWDVINDRVYADATFARTFGVDPEMARNGGRIEEFFRSIDPRDRGRVEQAIETAVRTGEDFAEEYRLVQADGSICWMAAQGRCSLALDGSPVRFPGVVFDITAVKHAAEALRSSEERFRKLFELSPVGVAMSDAVTGQLLFANQEMAAITGYDREELTRMTSSELTDPEDEDLNQELYRNVLSGSVETGVINKRYRRKDGETIWVRVTIRVVDNPSGEGSCILGAIENITESRNVHEALRASEEQLRQILASSRDCIKVLDLKGNLLSINAVGQARLGIEDLDQVIGRSWVDLWQGENREFAAQAVVKASRGGVGDFQGEYTTWKDEETSWDVTVTPIRDAQGSVSELLAVSREITLRKRTEIALRQSEKLAAVGRLASTIAHEINNPLESVTNLLYLARNSTDMDETQGYLTVAERELRRVSIISSQTLRFHKQRNEPVNVTADELLETVLSIYQGRLVNFQIEVERHRHSLRPVRCFDGEIRQVLNNLVANAIDAMHLTGGRLALSSHESTNWKTGERGMTISIADTGVGMTPQTRKKLFEAFFTTKGIGGAGLGLWLSRDIVQRHGGTLKVRSSQAPGRSGTTFSLFLPFDGARGVA